MIVFIKRSIFSQILGAVQKLRQHLILRVRTSPPTCQPPAQNGLTLWALVPPTKITASVFPHPPPPPLTDVISGWPLYWINELNIIFVFWVMRWCLISICTWLPHRCPLRFLPESQRPRHQADRGDFGRPNRHGAAFTWRTWRPAAPPLFPSSTSRSFRKKAPPLSGTICIAKGRATYGLCIRDVRCWRATSGSPINGSAKWDSTPLDRVTSWRTVRMSRRRWQKSAPCHHRVWLSSLIWWMSKTWKRNKAIYSYTRICLKHFNVFDWLIDWLIYNSLSMVFAMLFPKSVENWRNLDRSCPLNQVEASLPWKSPVVKPRRSSVAGRSWEMRRKSSCSVWIIGRILYVVAIEGNHKGP